MMTKHPAGVESMSREQIREKRYRLCRELRLEVNEMLEAIRNGDGSLAYLCAREAYRCARAVARYTPGGFGPFPSGWVSVED